MKERGPWRIWILLLLLAGNLYIPVAECQSYSGARGDEGGSPQDLGFDGVLARHDGYVKGETPTIPQTSFSCSAQPYNPGLYADTETQCQVYHVCFEDRQESFLCGPGTNFNQRILACDFWYNFDCKESPSFYNVNADIGKVPTAIFTPGQSRVPETQQPSYPSYPRQPEQPPSVGSYPPRVSIPPPPPRNQPQPPSIQPQPPKINVPRPEPPRIQPQPPRIQPQPPRIQPQPPRIQPQQPNYPSQQPNYPSQQPISPPQQPISPPQQPNYPPPQPQQPDYQPQRPGYQPQRPGYQPQQPGYPSQPPSFQPQQPAFVPQPRPDPPRVAVKPQYPSQPSGHGTGSRRPPPSIQQEEDSGFQFDFPSKPISLPPPPPPHPQTPRPSFPPVVSPPRVSRPPLTPAIIRQPEGSISRPRVPVTVTRPEFHPDSNLKGNIDYRPPQQPRIPQPSRPVGTGYPSYPVSQRPITPVSQRPVERPAYVPPPAIQQEHVDTEYVPQTPKEPSRPSTSYVPPPPQPKQPPRPSYVPPPQPPRPSYVPPPQPPRQPSRPSYVPPPQQPRQPSRPSYVPPPPPPPIQQEVTNIDLTKPPQKPSRPTYVPPPIPQQPIEPDYQPPVAPSIISEKQKPVGRPPSRPQVTGSGRQPQRPKPVFPPPNDHPNSNIKGGPGYQQPPPQIPRFEPTRISRPSSPQGGYVPPQTVRPRPESSISAVKPTGDKRGSASGSGGYKPPQQDRIKKPSEPLKEIYQPPIQVIDHPQSEIKGSDYRDPTASQQPQRIKSPSTSISGVKIPQTKINRQQPQVQRPRAPIVVSRPQPPSLPATTIKQTRPVDSQLYEKPSPQPPSPPPSRVKQPSQSQIQRTTQPRFPSPQPIDHPNANVKGGYDQSRQQIRPQPSRPSGPPSSPSTSYEQKTTSTSVRQPAGSGYRPPQIQPPRGDDGSVYQQVIQQQDFKPQRRPQTKTVSNSGIKTTGGYQRPQSASQQSIQSKKPNPNYDTGSSYTHGPDIYPKPEFGQPNSPYQPISTPSRSSQTTKQGSPSQNTITQTEIKPAYQGSPASSGFGTLVLPTNPHGGVPGHQPPNQPQIFPHRENPDHPNESIKGTGAYRPPPPAGFQAAASEVNEQKAAPEPEPQAAVTSLLGDIGAE